MHQGCLPLETSDRCAVGFYSLLLFCCCYFSAFERDPGHWLFGCHRVCHHGWLRLSAFRESLRCRLLGKWRERFVWASAVRVVTHLFTFVGYAATLVTGEEEHAERVRPGTYCACLQETGKLWFAAIWNAAGSPYRACIEVCGIHESSLFLSLFPIAVSFFTWSSATSQVVGFFSGAILTVIRFEHFSRIFKENFERRILGCRKCKWNIIMILLKQLCLQFFFFLHWGHLLVLHDQS